MWIARRIPSILLQQPWGVFIKSLCIVTGMATFFGPQPGSIQESLPEAMVFLWSSTLVLGAACGLYGLFHQKAWRMEITGLIWLGTASVVYAVAILGQVGIRGLVPAGIILAFGLAAFTRALAVYVIFEVARLVAQP